MTPCFVCAAGIGLFWLTEIDVGQNRDALATRIGNAAARVASALERHGALHDEQDIWTDPLPQELLTLLLADQAVRCAELRAEASGEVRLFAPIGLGCTGQVFDDSFDIPTSIGTDHVLVVYFSTAEIDEAAQSRREFSLLVLCVGLIIAILSSWLAFNFIVGRPLNQLLGAIQSRQQTGLPAPIQSDRRDELGVVMNAFDRMQAHLAREAAAVGHAFAQLERVYNTTPALLCSCDENGILTSVSDYLASTIGLDRDDLIGRSIEPLFESSYVPVFREKVLSIDKRKEKVRDIPLKVLSQDCRQIDVLLSAVPDVSIDGDLTILCVMSDISLLKAAERRLQKLALTDPLTSLPNRRGLVEHLSRVIHREKDIVGNSTTAVMFIDLDNFKWINDTYGHEAGDSLLIEVGERLRLCVRVNDFIARLGGDEFAIVCYRIESSGKTEEVAERIIEQLKKPFVHGVTQGFVSASIGIAYIEPDMEGPDSVLRLADLAMYDAKQAGKGCHRTYCQELSNKAFTTVTLREQIAKGLDEGGFSLAYQPIVDLESEIPVGVEVLLRLTCPTHGEISPDDFIPVAEETGQINELGSWVMIEGIKALAELDGVVDGANFYVTINISPRQLDDELIDMLEACFQRHPEARHRIVLEITETALLQRGDRVASLLGAARNRGVRIALDDFGTGYSSLSHVHRFPVDILKIDKSFVCGLGTSDPDATRRQMAMIRATSSMAQELGITVVAEGIEAAATSRILLDCGVGLGQGYLFSPPMLPGAFRDWLLGMTSEPSAGWQPGVASKRLVEL
ncbi:MAG: putative bifunctional diguanylate cyclase/phosphodiesterase [Geminicoccaceae bacterium]